MYVVVQGSYCRIYFFSARCMAVKIPTFRLSTHSVTVALWIWWSRHDNNSAQVHHQSLAARLIRKKSRLIWGYWTFCDGRMPVEYHWQSSLWCLETQLLFCWLNCKGLVMPCWQLHGEVHVTQTTKGRAHFFPLLIDLWGDTRRVIRVSK